jgi:HEAT repeat protein
MNCRPLLACSLLLLLCAAVATPGRARPAARADVTQLVEKLRSERDDAGYDTIRELGESRDPAAAQALVETYERLATLGARLATLRALSRFGGVEGAEQISMQKLLDVATLDVEAEVREVALHALSEAQGLGREYLAMVVDRPVDDAVRVRAMELHVAAATEADDVFYRRLWEGEKETSGRKPKRERGGEETLVLRRLPEVRELAFAAIVTRLELDQVVESAQDQSPVVRRTAVVELGRRQDEAAEEAAERMFKTREEWPENRLAAAEVLLGIDREKWIEEVVKEGSRRDTVLEEREGMARLVARFGDEDLFKGLAKKLGKGSDQELVFQVLALAPYKDEKLQKRLLELLESESSAVRLAAIESLAQRGVDAALEPLTERLAEAEEPSELSALLLAISELRGEDLNWSRQLAEYAASERQALRNAAVVELGRRGGGLAYDVLSVAIDHADWSTRLFALEGLEKLRDVRAVGLLVARMQVETGRIADAFADTLWRLTGQPFRRSGPAWARWWEESQQGFQLIDKSALRALEEERERKRLEESTTAPDFFGLRIKSHRVTFVIDISGSMEELTLSKYEGQKGPMRLEVAKAELARAIERLEGSALFNMVVFSSEVDRWAEELRRGTPETKTEAVTFVQGLRPGGGTNLFGALRVAFEDPEMDTLVVLSDGEPSVGDVIDPGQIRRFVELWNKERGVVVHTVQVGGRFKVLEWIAQDSGGDTVFIP